MARSKPNEYDDLAGELYDLTKVDWHVSASCIVTEPVCWVINIEVAGADDEDLIVYPKLEGFMGTGNVAESIRLGIDKLISMIKANAQDTD